MNRWLAVFAASCARAVLGFLFDRFVSVAPTGDPGGSFPRAAVEPEVAPARTQEGRGSDQVAVEAGHAATAGSAG